MLKVSSSMMKSWHEVMMQLSYSSLASSWDSPQRNSFWFKWGLQAKNAEETIFLNIDTFDQYHRADMWIRLLTYWCQFTYSKKTSVLATGKPTCNHRGTFRWHFLLRQQKPDFLNLTPVLPMKLCRNSCFCLYPCFCYQPGLALGENDEGC